MTSKPVGFTSHITGRAFLGLPEPKAAPGIQEGDRAFTSHGVGEYHAVLGGRPAPEHHLWLLIKRDDGGVQVELWKIDGTFVADVTHDPNAR